MNGGGEERSARARMREAARERTGGRQAPARRRRALCSVAGDAADQGDARRRPRSRERRSESGRAVAEGDGPARQVSRPELGGAGPAAARSSRAAAGLDGVERDRGGDRKRRPTR